MKLIDVSFETCVGVIRQNLVKLGKSNFNLFLDEEYRIVQDWTSPNLFKFKSFSHTLSDSAMCIVRVYDAEIAPVTFCGFTEVHRGFKEKLMAMLESTSAWYCGPIVGYGSPETMMQQNKEEG